MTDKELIKYCNSNFNKSSFTVNEIRIKLKIKNNSIHTQIFRIYKNGYLGKFNKDKVNYYYTL